MLPTLLSSAAICVAIFVLLISRKVLLILYRTTIYHHYISPLRHIPGPKPKPIFGNSQEYLLTPGAGAEIGWSQKYGRNGIFRSNIMFGTEAVHFMRPKALRKILIEDPYVFPKPSFSRKILGIIAGYGLLTVEGDAHKKMRKVMNPAFSLANLMHQFPIYYAKMAPLVQIMKKKVEDSKEPFAVVDCDLWVNRVLLDIICQTAFGYDANSVNDPDSELAQAYHQVFRIQNGRNQFRIGLFLTLPFGETILNWMSDKSGWEWALKRCKPDSLGETIFQLVNGVHRVKKLSTQMLYDQLTSGERASGSGHHTSIIDIIEETQSTENDGKPKSLEEAKKDMMAQVLTFLAAGHETTASGVSWTLWNLATHPGVQDKLRRECKELIDQDNQPPYSAVKSLVYLDAVINETMRVTPPVARIARIAQEPAYIDGQYIPKGTLLPISIRAINTDPEVWGPDAVEFKPERWLNLPQDYDRTFSMITFLAGAHGCIGRTMSYLEMKTVICILVSNFRFEPVSEEQSPVMDTMITMKPRGGLPLKVFKI